MSGLFNTNLRTDVLQYFTMKKYNQYHSQRCLNIPYGYPNRVKLQQISYHHRHSHQSHKTVTHHSSIHDKKCLVKVVSP